MRLNMLMEFWKGYPILYLLGCLGVFWLSKRLGNTKVQMWARVACVLGLMSNAIVTFANNGQMPVVGMPKGGPASDLWTDHGRLLLLADQRILWYCSVGDIIMWIGGAIIIGLWLGRKASLRKEELCSYGD